MSNFVSCIFCGHHSENLAAIIDHVGKCPEHPAVIESNSLREMADRLQIELSVCVRECEDWPEEETERLQLLCDQARILIHGE